MDRSTPGTTVSSSVAVLFAAFTSVTPAGAATVATLLIVPVAPAATVAATVYVIEEPGGSVTVSARLPVPLAILPVAPPVAALVKESVVNAAGKLSVTVAPAIVLGPAFDTTI